jgi:LysM repeat protein
MALNYEPQLSERTDDLTPDEISKMIVDNPLSSTANSTKTTPRVVPSLERRECAFGQYTAKKLNPKVLQEPDLNQRLAYCRLKLVALAQAQGYKNLEQAKIDDNDLLKKKAREHTQTNGTIQPFNTLNLTVTYANIPSGAFVG